MLFPFYRLDHCSVKRLIHFLKVTTTIFINTLKSVLLLSSSSPWDTILEISHGDEAILFKGRGEKMKENIKKEKASYINVFVYFSMATVI